MDRQIGARRRHGADGGKRRALISVNSAVLLFGLAGLFARWIRLPAIGITFGRVLFSPAALGIFLLVRRQRPETGGRRNLILLILAGVVLALHWWSFLESIQLSTVAVGTLTFSSFPLFVTFLEPLVFHRKLRRRDVITALVIVAGVLVTIPEFSFANHMFLGILTGMASAFAYAVLTLINKSMAGKTDSTVTAFIEQAAAAAVLLPFVLRAKLSPSPADIALLLLLGVVMTALAHTLFISSLKELPAQLAGVISSLETVYSILFALVLLGEVPSVREILGAAVILGAVISAQAADAAEQENGGNIA